jgi:hypothetical protein
MVRWVDSCQIGSYGIHDCDRVVSPHCHDGRAVFDSVECVVMLDGLISSVSPLDVPPLTTFSEVRITLVLLRCSSTND